MRLKFIKGKQKEFIEMAKVGKTWPELGVILGLNPLYLCNELRNEKVILSGEIYRKLSKINGEDYGNHILERLDDNWGRSKGGRNSANTLAKQINIPKDSVELAEFYGILLGDGNIVKMRAHKVGTYQIRIVGHSRDDKDYLLNYVKPLIESLFNISVGVRKHKYQNVLILYVTSRRLVEFLGGKGFSPGNKIKNELGIPEWIKNKKNFLKSCIRGLYDTDGGIYRLNNQNTVQIDFTNYNLKLLREVRDCLILLKINPSEIMRARSFRITRRSELRKFLKHIGFSNFKHFRKVEMWKDIIYSPVV